MKNLPKSILLLYLALGYFIACSNGKKDSEDSKAPSDSSVTEGQVLASSAKETSDHKMLPATHPFAICASCHGTDGEGNQKMLSPRLSGQNIEYIKHQIISYKKGWRASDPKNPQSIIMAEIAKNLSDDELNKISTYIKNVSSEKEVHRVYGNTLRGERLYRENGCSYCHGDSAEGDSVNKVPRLNHQHGWYILKQLKNFKNGTRGTHKDDAMGQTMAFYAKSIKSEEDIHDLAAWISSFSRKK
ncbi:c-type cytochrome [Lentisphaera marina]|uniref:c-type cytochrome n=1 Tax=Lentisphaera marina TaxID=1111041 RepID=UPI0023661D2B|nr:c-type cytochrome [Lentisphaera marina]MDD7985013.1 c-type cytochrome [Lentisphaera marina]